MDGFTKVAAVLTAVVALFSLGYIVEYLLSEKARGNCNIYLYT